MHVLSIFLSIPDTATNIVKSVGGFSGAYETTEFLWCLFFALIGHLLVTFLDVSTRDVNKPGTPLTFSWIIFLENNLRRILRNIFLIYISIRFYPQLIGKELTDFGALIAGISVDGAYVILKKLNIFKKLK